MAFTRLSLPFSWLLLSLLVLAFAEGYGDDSSKYGYDGIPADSPQAKPEGEVKPNYGEKPGVYKPKPEGEAKPEYGSKPEREEKPYYDAKPGTYKPKPEGEAKPEYGSKPEGEEKSYYDAKPGTNYKPKPEGEAKPEYGSKPEGGDKPNYDAKPGSYKPNPEEKSGYEKKTEGEESLNYGTKEYNYKQKEDEKEKPGYERQPYVVKPKPEGEEKPNYGTKPEIYKPKPEEKEKPEYERKPYVVKAKPEGEEKPVYDTIKPDFYKPKPEEKEKPYYGTKPEETEKLLSIGVQGRVLCKSGSEYYPIKGASAKVKCQAVDELGLEKTLPVCSVETDAKGYFFRTFSSLDLVDKSWKLKDCKAFLERSPLESCKVPTDVNKGITGAPFSGYRVLNDQKHTKLYSVGPFFFTSEPKSIPNGY